MLVTVLAILVILFLIAPILILFPISFSPTSYIVFPNQGFSTKWYEKLFSDAEWMMAIQNSLKIAVITTVVSLGTVLGMVIAHTVIALPFVVTTMNAGLESMNNNFEDAAVNLGANRFLAFFHVTLPMLRSSIGSSVLFAFLTSFDEIAVTLFITGPSVITIPKKMWDGIRLQIEPTIAALSVILVSTLTVGFLLITFGQMIKSVRHKMQL